MRRQVETFEVSYTEKDATGKNVTSFEYFQTIRKAFRFMEKHPGSVVKMVWK